ncbi:DUF1501 domain-containing protein [Colwellia piezophila]|uniref:DUF1501 domain-containing protein n=1 Tax=Colwellia piezophila TaxID=211668 RepID=UPI000382B922|nr:DUF1501 domain-containing protein [Colwellia piezophila]
MSHVNNNTEAAILSRRKFIKMAGAGLAVLSFPMSSTFAFGADKQKANPKIVWLLLRGALDSMHTIIPSFDPQYKTLRPKLSASFKAPLLPLQQGFFLHPSLKNMHTWYQEKSLLPIVAVSSGYQKRSHFDGQDFLESGKGQIDHDSGWLSRAIDVKNKRALAISRATPISLRGSKNSTKQVSTWYPSKFDSAEHEVYSELAQLYQHDEALKENLENGLEVLGLVGAKNAKTKKRQGKFIDLSKACAKFMVGEQGVDCAMLELGGWDTHNNQSFRLNRQLSELDQGLAALKSGLGDEWQNTVIIIGTEFGRTAKENGTGGTDHGTGSALFLAGGAVNGGKVQGKWPGLKADELFEQRDLMPTTNSFGWIGNILSQHWQFTEQELRQVFPQVKAYNEALVKA